MTETKEPIYWKCTKCGFTLTVPEPPKVCPQCREACEFKDVSCYLPDCGGTGNVDPRL